MCVCVCACNLCFSAAIICACVWEFVQSAGLSGSVVGSPAGNVIEPGNVFVRLVRRSSGAQKPKR